jgi:hypothetical protein
MKIKLVCVIENSGYFFTLNKIYDGYSYIPSDITGTLLRDELIGYMVMNDKGVEHLVETTVFKRLDEIREEKLNIIFNEK